MDSLKRFTVYQSLMNHLSPLYFHVISHKQSSKR